MRFALLIGIIAICIGAALLQGWYDGSAIDYPKVPSEAKMDADSVVVSPYSKSIFSHPYFNKADSFLEARNFDSAIYHYKAAIIRFNREGLLRGSVKALAKLGITFKRERCETCMDSAIHFLTVAENLGANRLGKTSIDLAGVYYYLGEAYVQTVPQEALKHYLKNTEIISKYFKNKPNFLISNTYMVIGELYFYQLADYIKAEYYYEASLKNIELIKDSIAAPSHQLIERYLNIVKVCMAKGDYFKGIRFVEKALEWADSTVSNADFVKCNAIAANVYFESGDYVKAEKMYEKVIDFYKSGRLSDSTNLTKYYNNLGAASLEQGKLDKALVYLRTSEQLNRSTNLMDLSDTFFNMAQVYRSANKFSLSKRHFFKSLETLEAIHVEKHEAKSLLYNEIGNLYSENEDYKSALQYYQEALIALLGNFKTKNIYISPDTSSLFNSRLLYEIFHNKAAAFKKIYLTDTAHVNLTTAIANHALGDYVMQLNRSSYDYEESKLSLVDNYKKNYEEALDALFRLPQQHRSNASNDYVLQVMENSKSPLLVESHNKSYAALNIPEGIVEEERSLKQKIIQYTLQLEKAKRSQNNGSEVKKIDSVVFVYEKRLETFNNENVLKHPYYFNTNHHSPLANLSSVQSRLQASDQIIHFFWGDSSVYVLNIQASQIKLDRIARTPRLDNNIRKFLELTSSFHPDSVVNTHAEYSRVSFELYKTLLQNSLTPSEDKKGRLFIIPDGPLSFVPFEALTTNVKPSNDGLYKDLPYLLYMHDISYAYSINLLRLDDRSTRNVSRLVVYDALEKGNRFEDNHNRNAFTLKNLVELVPAEYVSKERCNEENFKKAITTCDAIHLNVHGEGRDGNYMSRLFFNKGKYSHEDDTLYAEELYAQNLNHVELFVLNACETAIGSTRNGEGVYSIARGITFAGCPTVMMSLWKIPVSSTFQIMNGFYKHAVLNYDLGEALRESKINYIKSSDGLISHPSFWAGMVLQGDTNAIQIEKTPALLSSHYKIVFGLLAIILLSLFVYKRQVSR